MAAIATFAGMLVLLALGVRRFFRAASVLLPPADGDDPHDPTAVAARRAAASGFDMQ